ncbi:MAG: helix-turn-helix transcriptional regulator [Deltaproteobacteria bacterium]|nr:helix-turn-helix transcriptional regulator [Deltaproteobacteria bacterium]
MSKTRQSHDPEARLLVRTYAVTHPANLGIEARSFDRWDQLAYAARGVMNVTTVGGTWVVPPHRAVWIPAGVEHAVAMTGRVQLRTVFFRRAMTRQRMPRSPCAVNVPPLLRELILEATRVGLLHRDVPAQARLARVMVDRMETLPVAPLQLPMPAEPRARRAAEVIIEHPGRPGVLANAARKAGATRRTLERLFLAQTQMTLGRWRQRARLISALRRLAEGRAVTEVALDVGYATPSAFIAAFRSELGTTPRRYFDLSPPG